MVSIRFFGYRFPKVCRCVPENFSFFFFFFANNELSTSRVKIERKGFALFKLCPGLIVTGTISFSPTPRVASYSAQTERAEETGSLRKEDSILVMDHHEPCRGTSISGTCSSIQHVSRGQWNLGSLGMTIAF